MESREVYVTSEPQEAVALHALLTVAGIENTMEKTACGTCWLVSVEFPQDLERARAERERWFHRMGWN